MYHAAGEQLLQEPCEAGFAAAAAAVDRNDSGSAALRQPLYRQKGGEVARVGGAKQAVMRPVGGAERLAVAGRRAALSAVGCHPARHAGDRQGGEGVQPPRQPVCGAVVRGGRAEDQIGQQGDRRCRTQPVIQMEA